MYRELLEEAKTMEADLIAWRRRLHTMPELGLELLIQVRLFGKS